MVTELFIRRLAASARPVLPLAPPWRRVMIWFFLAVPMVALIVLAFSLRPDLGARVTEWRYVVEQASALATAVLAAWAAFSMTIPGSSRGRVWMALLPLAIWISVVLQGCLADAFEHGWSRIPFQADWVCLPMIAAVGAWPAIVMVVMLRRGAPLTPNRTIAMGALASAGLGNVALRLFHAQDVSLTVLVWHVGSALLLATIASWAGPTLLRWRSDLVRATVVPSSHAGRS